MQQLYLIAREAIKPVEPRTTVRIGKKAAKVPLARRHREATEKLLALLAELEGKDILISYCGGSRSHWWFDDLRLNRLKVERGLSSAGVLVLRGTNHQNVRIFLNCLWDIREQNYDGKPYWLVDFWNGWGEYPIDPYRPKGYQSLTIKSAR